jgi:hypothetical protein
MLASCRFSWGVHVWSLTHTNKGTGRREEEHSLFQKVCRLSVDEIFVITMCKGKIEIVFFVKVFSTCLHFQSPPVCQCLIKQKIVSGSENILLESGVYFLPKTRYLCLCQPFFFMKQSWTNKCFLWKQVSYN